MAQTIQIKRSSTTAVPSELAAGELAFSGNGSSNSLFIGDPTGAEVIRIGGAKYAFLHQAGSPGVLTVNAVPIVNATGYIDEWKTDRLWIGTANVTAINSVANSTVLGLASNTEIPTSWAVKTYVDSAAIASSLNGLSDVALDDPSSGQVLVFDASSSEFKNRSVTGTANEVDVVANNTTLQIGLPNNVTVAANLVVSSALGVTGAANVGNTLGVIGAVSLSNTLVVTGNTTLSNTLSVVGTASFSGDVTVAGNLTVSGTVTTLETENLVVQDPLIKLALNNDESDVVDIGFYGLYNDGANQYAGVFRDATDGKFRFFRGLETEPGVTVNTAAPGYAIATVVGAFEGALISSSVTITGGSITGITDLAVGDGGTGVSSFTTNGVFYASNTTTLAFATGNAGEVLQLNGSGLPVFDMLDGGTF